MCVRARNDVGCRLKHACSSRPVRGRDRGEEHTPCCRQSSWWAEEHRWSSRSCSRQNCRRCRRRHQSQRYSPQNRKEHQRPNGKEDSESGGYKKISQSKASQMPREDEPIACRFNAACTRRIVVARGRGSSATSVGRGIITATKVKTRLRKSIQEQRTEQEQGGRSRREQLGPAGRQGESVAWQQAEGKTHICRPAGEEQRVHGHSDHSTRVEAAEDSHEEDNQGEGRPRPQDSSHEPQSEQAGVQWAAADPSYGNHRSP